MSIKKFTITRSNLTVMTVSDFVRILEEGHGNMDVELNEELINEINREGALKVEQELEHLINRIYDEFGNMCSAILPRLHQFRTQVITRMVIAFPSDTMLKDPNALLEYIKISFIDRAIHATHHLHLKGDTDLDREITAFVNG